MYAAAVLVSLLWVVPGIVGQTVRIAGDSTMAKGGGGKGTDGKPSYTNTCSLTPPFNVLRCRMGTILGTVPFPSSSE